MSVMTEINSQWARTACIAAAVLMAVSIFITAGPDAEPLIVLVPPWDKVVHFLYYGTMALLLAHGVGRSWLILPLLLVPAVGALDEWNQAGIVGRDASFFDWLADEAGTIVAVLVYRYLIVPERTGNR